MTVICEQCDRTFSVEHGLEQHRRDSPAHAVTHDCEKCNRAFDTEQALEQHRRDSPAHAIMHDCESEQREAVSAGVPDELIS